MVVGMGTFANMDNFYYWSYCNRSYLSNYKIKEVYDEIYLDSTLFRFFGI